MLYRLVKSLSEAVDSFIGASRLYKEYLRKREPLILESATGFGLNLSLVLERVLELGGRVYSIDVSRLSTALARLVYYSFIRRGVLVVEEGDLTRLKYEDSKFDYSVNHTTMHHVGDVRAAVRELWRTLKSGGLLIIVDLNPLPLGVGSHSPSKLLSVKESVRSSVEELFKVVERGEGRLSYHIVAEKP